MISGTDLGAKSIYGPKWELTQNVGTKSIFSAKERKKKKEKKGKDLYHLEILESYIFYLLSCSLLFPFKSFIQYNQAYCQIFFFFFFFLVLLICLQSIELVTSTNYERKSDVDMVVKIINYKIIEMVILFLTTLNLRINYNWGELIPS